MYAGPEVMRYVGDGRTLTHGDTERSVKRMIERWEADGFGLFTTVRQDDGAVIGRVGLLVWYTATWAAATRAGEGRGPGPVWRPGRERAPGGPDRGGGGGGGAERGRGRLHAREAVLGSRL